MFGSCIVKTHCTPAVAFPVLVQERDADWRTVAISMDGTRLPLVHDA